MREEHRLSRDALTDRLEAAEQRVVNQETLLTRKEQEVLEYQTRLRQAELGDEGD